MDIRLSQEHGFNPGIAKCFYCNKDKNELVLFGQLPGDREAPRGAVLDMEPCDQCREMMRAGVILISATAASLEQVQKDAEEHRLQHLHVRPGQQHPLFVPNPYRTGGWCVLRDEAVLRILPHFCRRSLQAILEENQALITLVFIVQRWGFLPDHIWDAIPLPRGNAELPAGTPTSLAEFRAAQARQQETDT